jgi:hypothetical protein
MSSLTTIATLRRFASTLTTRLDLAESIIKASGGSNVTFAMVREAFRARFGR